MTGTTILAVDLGKYKCVACAYDRATAAGWKVTPTDATTTAVPPHTTTLTECPTDNGPADYVLCNAGRVVSVVEAKKLAVNPAGVLTQAERYARGVRHHSEANRLIIPKPGTPPRACTTPRRTAHAVHHQQSRCLDS